MGREEANKQERMRHELYFKSFYKYIISNIQKHKNMNHIKIFLYEVYHYFTIVNIFPIYFDCSLYLSIH